MAFSSRVIGFPDEVGVFSLLVNRGHMFNTYQYPYQNFISPKKASASNILASFDIKDSKYDAYYYDATPATKIGDWTRLRTIKGQETDYGEKQVRSILELGDANKILEADFLPQIHVGEHNIK